MSPDFKWWTKVLLVLFPMIIFIGCTGCFFCSDINKCCYRNIDRYYGGDGVDSDTED